MSMNPLPASGAPYARFDWNTSRSLPAPALPPIERRSRSGGRPGEHIDWDNARRPAGLDAIDPGVEISPRDIVKCRAVIRSIANRISQRIEKSDTRLSSRGSLLIDQRHKPGP